MDCHALLQGIFLTQGLNPSLLCLLHLQVGSLSLAPLGLCGIPFWTLIFTSISSCVNFLDFC